MTLSTLLYVSDLADGSLISAVAAIAGEARLCNERDAITGILLFDGAHFGQLVEGPTGQLESLLVRLRRDPRHVAMEILNFAPMRSERTYTEWRLGFIETAVRGGVDGLRGLQGEQAVQAFLRLLPPLTAAFEHAGIAA